MYNYPSRNEKRENRFYSRAKKGFLCSEEVLYPSEIKKLKNQGYEVLKIRDFEHSHAKRNLIVAKVSWEHAYGYEIPCIVHEYIMGNIDTFPYSMIYYFSQELFIIAQRTIHKNSK